MINLKKFMRPLPPGKGLSVSLSIVRPLKIESAGVIFLFRRVNIWSNHLVFGNSPGIQF